jgi:recombinational DNA repair protein (RecF pathway)
MMALTSHGLYRKLSRPANDTAMSACYVCHKATAGVDLGVYISFEGSLFLCLNCIREAAEIAGFRVNAEGEQLEREVEWLKVQTQQLTSQLSDANEQLDAVGLAVAHAANRPDTSTPNPSQHRNVQ